MYVYVQGTYLEESVVVTNVPPERLGLRFILAVNTVHLELFFACHKTPTDLRRRLTTVLQVLQEHAENKDVHNVKIWIITYVLKSCLIISVKRTICVIPSTKAFLSYCNVFLLVKLLFNHQLFFSKVGNYIDSRLPSEKPHICTDSH